MNVVVCGLGCVGTTTAACLLQAGHRVAGVDVDPVKNRAFAAGRSPVFEPDVDERLRAGRIAGRLGGGASVAGHAAGADVILVCVGTPVGPGGVLDLSQVLSVTAEIGAALARRPAGSGAATVVYRSTMLPGSMERVVMPALAASAGPPGGRYEVAYNPEFLREGTAVQDYLAPPRIVIGERRPGDARRLREMYRGVEAPVFEVTMAVAEMIKYADNGFHALKVAFANELGRLAGALDVPVQPLAEVFLADTALNLSAAYLRPGGAFGGSCLPKDLRALNARVRESGVEAPVMEAVLRSNDAHKTYLVEQAAARAPRGGRVLLLGLTFKLGTDDLRESPLVDLAESLLDRGFDLTIHDPDLRVERLTGVNLDLARTRLRRLLERLTDDVNGAVDAADLIVIGKPAAGLAVRLAGDARALDLARLK